MPEAADWIFVGEFSEGVDESLRSPARVWIAKKGDEFFLKIDDGSVTQEKTHNGWNLVGLMHNIAPTGSAGLKQAITHRTEFDEIAPSVDFRLKRQSNDINQCQTNLSAIPGSASDTTVGLPTFPTTD